MKKVIIIGATSGLGKALAIHYAQNGCVVGISGRRAQLLYELQQQFPANIFTSCFDVCGDVNIAHLEKLLGQTGGADLFIYNSGYADLSESLDWEIDKQIYETNVKGFIEMTNYMFRYFMKQGYGHIAGTSSIASNRGNSHAPAYSASKAFMSIYLEGLYMKAKKMQLPIAVTDVQPGFLKTKPSKGHGQFWVAPVDKAVKQIASAIEKKKWRAYVTKRWMVVALLMRNVPGWLYHRMA